MSRIKLILLSMLALVAISALASASASATVPLFLTCLNVGSGKGQWEDAACSKAKTGGGWETSAVTTALEISGTGGVAKLKSELLGAEILITCTKNTIVSAVSDLEAEGKSKGEVTFEECKVGNSKETFVNCEVPNIKFKFTDQLILVGTEVKDEFKGVEKEGTQFVEISIKNKEEKACTQKGKFPVTGTQIALLPEPTVFKHLHLLDFSTADSSLTFNTKPATFEGSDEIYLLSGAYFAISL